MRSFGKALRSTWNSVFGPGKQNRRRRARALAEGDQLENRRLLATLVNTTTLTYQDIDGDNVTVKFSKPILTSQTTASTIFTFSTGFPGVTGSNALKQQLQSINLADFATAAGTTVTTTAVRSPVNGGDGFAAIGQIDATGRDLGAVTIDGDLGRILAGDSVTTTQGLGALRVHSMGRFGRFTGATNLNTTIQGAMASFTTKTDVVEANVRVLGGVNGKLGTVTIGGSLIGGNAEGSGQFFTDGDIGAVKITGNMIGGAGNFSGRMVTVGKLASISIGGSMVGGSGFASGQIFSQFDLGAVTITGSVVGGAGDFTGRVEANAKLTSVTIGGSLIGGSGKSSGQVFSGGTMGPVVITGDVRGGSFVTLNFDEAAGAVVSKANIASVTIGGSLIGGAGTFSGLLASGLSSGPVRDMGAVKIAGNVIGSNGNSAGAIISSGKLASVTISGSLIGGAGLQSGSVTSSLDMGAVIIKGDLIGGSNGSTGSIQSGAKLASVAIGGSLRGGTGDFSGIVSSRLELTTLTITGDIIGGSASGASNLSGSGVVQAGRIGTLTLGGSLIAGTDNTSGTFEGNGFIFVSNDIASATIKGSIIGNATHRAQIIARGQLAPVGTTDLAIGKLTVTGRVEHSLISVGSTEFGENADAQIGPVVIGGDWIASDLVAGASAGVDGKFGTADDVKLSGAGVKDVATVSSKITSIVIGGQVLGTFGGTDHFGFVAQNIGSFKVKNGGTTFPLLTGNGNDDFLIGLFLDLRLNEIL